MTGRRALLDDIARVTCWSIGCIEKDLSSDITVRHGLDDLVPLLALRGVEVLSLHEQRRDQHG